MPVERAAGGTSLVDVLDRVLDKGIVIDAWVRVSLVGIDLITVEARVVVASIDTYLKYAEAVGQVSTVSRPSLEPAAPAEVLTTDDVLLEARPHPRRPRRKRAGACEEAPESKTMIKAEHKLALTELLLGTIDASVCAQRALEWLGQHIAPGRALLATAASDPGRLWGIAALGISPARTGEFVLDLDDRRDPLVSVAWSGKAHHFRPGRRQPETPLESVPFYAVPVRPDRQLPPLGLLLIESDEPDIDDDIRWFADILGEKFRNLRQRNVTADPGLDRERHLLYSIINAVTDPILLTDESGKLIIGNSRAEQLFAFRADESEGRRRAVEINNLFFSSALAGRLVEDNTSSAREVILVDPEDGSDLLFELLTSRMALERDASPWCRSCATSPIWGGPGRSWKTITAG